MAEGTYEYELERAELLGIAPPNKEAFEEAMQARRDEENAKLLELEIQDEQLKYSSGKLDEVNSILSITQQRINKLKNVCGSLTNLLKIRSGKDDESSTEKGDEAGASAPNAFEASTENNSLDCALDTLDAMKDQSVISDAAIMKKRASDMQQKMSCQFDALDSMLSKAENAQYSMAQQNKDMKRLLQ